MRFTLIVATIMLIICCSDGEKKINNMSGIWIPEKIDWNDGSFKTFYFYNDTLFTILSSTQKKIKDSIYFQAEPGYGLSQGSILNKKDAKGNEIIVYKVLYKFIVLPDEKVPSNDVKDSIRLSYKGKKVISFQYKGVKFVKTNKYTKHSENSIKSFPIKMIPQLKKKYEIMK